MNKASKIITIILIIILSIITFYYFNNPSETNTKFKVKEVIDGDTFILSTGEHVRLLGVDTPEKEECYYQEAKNFLTRLLKDRLVSLEKDKTNKDSYGRLLRYVYLDNKEVNLILVEKGYAEAFNRYLSTTSQYSEIKKLESKAKENKLGRWNCS